MYYAIIIHLLTPLIGILLSFIAKIVVAKLVICNADKLSNRQT